MSAAFGKLRADDPPVNIRSPFRYHLLSMIDLLFGNSYEALLMGIALIAAIPYGIYVGLKKLGSRISGGKDHGDTRTGR